ncbi:DUF4278 domain-containing protein [Leptothoe kymatousa]|uniref:DUF4278 domain-containing protein n=1 Tax=Leptothoe kymatousa TAU-MAC 1615 TaxID=2364775 RepID=A0ABS5Y740_9CYAN|nr:DUF4278 domain-containing protein [Leptothoe kymatousa]MBT9313642.1 DUF4278 domain-containing protein [Leptothoe kymatousa TAU-MAC 1615]
MQLSYRGVKYTVPQRNVTVEDGDTACYRGASYRVKKAVGAAHSTISGLRYRGAQVR